jgi:hypothetical protein
MWGVGLLVVPILWILGEGLPSPLIECVENQPWWTRGRSVTRVFLGVLAVLPIFAYMVTITWLFRRWLGIPEW